MPSLVLFVNLLLKKPVYVKWSGLVTSFQAKLERNKENRAYVLGAEAAQSGKSMIGPFERGSPPDSDWVDGYLDALFIRNL